MNLPRTFVLTVDRPIARFTATAAHLDSLGIKWERLNGFDNQLCKLSPVETFDLDRAGERIGSKHIAACLSHYLLWTVMFHSAEEVFWALEYDVRLVEDWRARYEQIMRDVPDDWDLLYIGNCCCQDRETKHIKGDVYEVLYPLCGHAIQIRKRALPTLLAEHQRISMPLDIAMFYWSLPKLRVYTVLPALVTQAGTPLPP